MKSWKKISSVTMDKKKKLILVRSKNDEFLSLPFSRLSTVPSAGNPILDIWVDKELGSQAVTFKLKDGMVDSIPLDAFLDFNKDPEYLRSLELYQLTLKAEKLLDKSGMSKREVARRMGTSMSQLSRLLDATDQKKSIDQMMKLLTILGATVTVKVA